MSAVTEKTDHPWRKQLETLLLPEEEIVRDEYKPPVGWQNLFSSVEVAMPIKMTGGNPDTYAF